VLDLILRLAHAYGSLGLAMQAAAVAVFALLTTVFGVAMVVLIPRDHFIPRRSDAAVWWRSHPLLHGGGLVVKNTLGIFFIAAGALMALPLVPGPGLLFMLLGFSIIDFPGKRNVERRLLAVPTVLRSLNAIRARFNRPPLLVEEPRSGAGGGPAGGEG